MDTRICINLIEKRHLLILVCYNVYYIDIYYKFENDNVDNFFMLICLEKLTFLLFYIYFYCSGNYKK